MSNDDKQLSKTQSSLDADQENMKQVKSPGKQLKEAREDQGLTQLQVADRLHLRINSVKAIEDDAVEEGLSVTFSKGYVRLYARLLHLEIQPLLDAYDELHERNNPPAKLQSFSKRVSREASDHKWNMVTIIVVLLVIGSVIGWWVQQSDSLTTSQGVVSGTFDNLFSESEKAEQEAKRIADAGKSESVGGQALAGQSVSRLNAGPAIEEDELSDTLSNITDLTESDEPTPNSTALTDTLSQSSKSTLTSAKPSQGIRNDNTAAGASKTVNGIAINADGSVNMAFTFKTDCWVSIKDVNDEIIAIGVKKQDRVMKVSGLAPIKVILCSPDNVAINFGGKKVDMSLYPAGQTANFSLTVES